MLKVIFLLLDITAVCLGYKPWECPTEILEYDRVDCFPEPGAEEMACRARGCEWCETYQGGLPWCFYNDKPGFDGTCKSSLPLNQREDCWPYPEGSNAKCVDAGCVWCPDDNAPWCFYDDEVPVVTTVPPMVTTTQATGTTTTTAPPTGSTPQAGCPSLIDPYSRVDCYPSGGASQSACESKGCIWCEHSDPVVPWCSYPDQNGGGGDPGSCPSDIPDEERIDCYPDAGSSKENCEARLCIWCESSVQGTPWCFFNSTGDSGGEDSYRIDCAPDGNMDKDLCESRGCVFMGTNEPGAPVCFFPEDRGYAVNSLTPTSIGWDITLQKVGAEEVYSTPVDTVKVVIEMQTDERIHIKFTDPSNTRFEVPLEDLPSPPVSAPSSPLYDISVSTEPVFSFAITRKSTGNIIYDTSIGGLVFEDQFLQIVTKLPNDTALYGLGESEHHSFKHSMFWKKYGMYARDQPPYHDWNMYGAHPFYMAVDGNFDAHGVLILNANAQDFELSPAPYIAYRTIGGILDIYVFVGPTPEEVVSQYTQVIGRPYFPPYWSLGFQLCRYGYNNLQTLQATVDRMRAANIPYDVQYGDIDYMDQQRDFTVDPVNYVGLGSYVDTIKSYGMHYIIILDPCIDSTVTNYPAFDEAPDTIWVKESTGTLPIPAKVWPPGTCYFPDYTNPDTETWWVDQCVKFRDVLEYDGIWIDMNEPANFVAGSTEGCNSNKWNNPPYRPHILGSLADKTVCPDALQTWGKHYDVHNLFGYSQTLQTLPAARLATGKRSIVISRSTFPGSGKYSGHWLGDNYSQWSNLYYSVIGCLEFNLFGIPYIGADICGFNGDTNEQLCQRWMQLGAFYTYARNHNGIGYRAQDPPALGSEVERVSREVLQIRYTLLPYLYTLFYHANVDGHTVMRPLFHEFYTDTTAYDIDRQFLWGPAFLISPVLDQDAVTVDVYFPDARWYDYYTGMEETGGRGKTINLNAPMDYIPLHVRGGYILPTQEHAVTTTISRTNPMGLIIALDDAGEANGDLYWDDGDEADAIENGNYFHSTFTVSTDTLTNTINRSNYPGASALTWGTFRVLGLTSVSSVTINGSNHGSFSFNPSTKELTITNVGVSVTSSLTVSWS